MAEIQEIDRCLVVIFDIEGFSKEDPETQAELVDSFIQVLDNSLKGLEDTKPDAFSTGDGAIVSVGRNCKLDKRTVKLFIDFVINCAANMLKEGLIIRTAVNYSEKNRVVMIDASVNIQGKYIQIGDAINNAVRIMNFCEPREIMIDESVHNFLRQVGLGQTYPFFKNDRLTTKHNVILNTFTYDPPEDKKNYFYSPRCSSHYYKKFSYFPPVKTSILEYFMQHGLDFELKNVIAYAFESVRELNDTMKFVSWHNVLDVLTQLRYDSSDTVYVLSRNDRAGGFWTQPRKNQYINYLKTCAAQYSSRINQTRVLVYDESEPDRLMPEDDIFYDLEKLHNTNTLFSFPSKGLLQYEKLDELIFGFTLSMKHKYAVIPIPGAEAFGLRAPRLDNIGEALKPYEGYDTVHGPMKAIITGDDKYVEELIKEMQALLKDYRIAKLK